MWGGEENTRSPSRLPENQTTQESGPALPLLRWAAPSVLTGVIADPTSDFFARYTWTEEASKQEVLPVTLKADFPRVCLCF